MLIPGSLKPSNISFFVCDVQTRFEKLIPNYENVVKKSVLMVNAAKVLGSHVYVTEQVVKTFGHTDPRILEAVSSLPADRTATVEKKAFAMDKALSTAPNNDTVILFGFESHVCVQQTALKLLKEKNTVVVLADSIGSRNPFETDIALRLLEKNGAIVTSSESILFDIMETADHKDFKNILTLLK